MLQRIAWDQREDGLVSVIAATYRLQGPDGAWTGTGRRFDLHPFSEAEGAEDRLMSSGMVVLTGEGEYEGLTAGLVQNVRWADLLAGTAAAIPASHME